MRRQEIGRLMHLRLKAPGHERFFQSPALEATFGGGESNVAGELDTSKYEVLSEKVLEIYPGVKN